VRRTRHRRQRRVLRRQRCAPRPRYRVLPRVFGRQVRAPCGAHGPRARCERRCNPESPLGDLFSPGNLVKHSRRQNVSQRPLQKG
jgi:hypothetical protein